MSRPSRSIQHRGSYTQQFEAGETPHTPPARGSLGEESRRLSAWLKKRGLLSRRRSRP